MTDAKPTAAEMARVWIYKHRGSPACNDACVTELAAEIRAAQAEVWEEAAWKVRSGHDSCSNAELCRAVLADEFERLAAALLEGQ